MTENEKPAATRVPEAGSSFRRGVFFAFAFVAPWILLYFFDRGPLPALAAMAALPLWLYAVPSPFIGLMNSLLGLILLGNAGIICVLVFWVFK